MGLWGGKMGIWGRKVGIIYVGQHHMLCHDQNLGGKMGKMGKNKIIHVG